MATDITTAENTVETTYTAWAEADANHDAQAIIAEATGDFYRQLDALREAAAAWTAHCHAKDDLATAENTI